MRNWLVVMKIAFRVIFTIPPFPKWPPKKIDKLLMVSDFKDNWYLGVFWSEELVGNDEICSQGHFYEATIFKMAANKIVKLSMVWFQWKLISRDFKVRNWLVPWILIWGLFGNFCVCIKTQSNLVIIIIIIIIIIIPLLFLRMNLPDQILREWWSDLY